MRPAGPVRALFVCLSAPMLGAVLAACGGGGTTSASTSASTVQSRAQAPSPSSSGVTAQLAPYRLTAPLSREVVLPTASGLRILGGLAASQNTVGGVFDLNTSTGSLSSVGQLAVAVHDAAGVVQDGHDLVLGGGSPNTIATVQRFGPGASGSVLSRLPRPRSDLTAVTVGGRVYILGGYDGTTLDPAVLVTSDGRSFTRAATLPHPVRYPATAVVGGRIYLLGGANGSGSTNTTAIQEVDPATGRATVVGHLPQPLAHAAAMTVNGIIYVLGGVSNGGATDAIERFDPSTHQVRAAGFLPQPVSDAGAAPFGGTTYLVGGEDGSQSLSTVIEIRPGGDPPHQATATWRPGQAPFTGRLLIADRGNNRLLLVDADKQVLWSYPSATAPAPAGGFYFPDDAFFARRGTEIISNEEDNHTIVRLAFPSGRILWSYGHPRVPGSSPGYLNQPDDAYLLRDGTVTVADATNCRILFISPAGRPTSQIGTTGSCVHHPPTSLGYPNGDTPLPDGNVLISEVHGSWVSEYTPAGALVWTQALPISYPSDPQQLGPDLYLVADYARPGGLYEFDRLGHILWSYRVPSGPGMLDHPSLAERLPNGLLAVNDDYRHRVVIIDPLTDAIVWQYGVTDTPGTGPGQLNTPDGFDLLAPGGTTPTHPQTG